MNLRKVMKAVLIPAMMIGTAQAQHVEFFKNYRPITMLSGGGNAVAGTLDSNVVVAGTEIISGFGTVITVLKTKLNGDTLWVRHYGGIGKDFEGHSITSLSTGQYLVAGLQKDTADNAPEEALLMSLAADGTAQWTKTYPMAGYGTALHDLQPLADGYAICGTKRDITTGLADAWLIKTNLTGDSLWTKAYGGTDDDDARELEKTPDGGFLLAGGSFSYRTGTAEEDAWLVKTNASGEFQWMKNYGVADKMDWINAVTPAVTDGILTGYIFTGVKNYTGTANSELFLAKVDTLGNLLWDKSMTGEASFRQGFCIEQSENKGFYIAAAEYSNTIGFQLMGIKVDKDGNVVNKVLYGNNEAITPHGMFLNNAGDAFITGQRYAAPSGNSLFLARIRDINKPAGSTGLQLLEKEAEAITVYPNPARTECVVSSKNEPINHIRLTDMTGRTLMDRPAGGSLTEKIALDHMPKGVYLLSVTTGYPNTRPDQHFAPVVLRLTIQ